MENSFRFSLKKGSQTSDPSGRHSVRDFNNDRFNPGYLPVFDLNSSPIMKQYGALNGAVSTFRIVPSGSFTSGRPAWSKKAMAKTNPRSSSTTGKRLSRTLVMIAENPGILNCSPQVCLWNGNMVGFGLFAVMVRFPVACSRDRKA